MTNRPMRKLIGLRDVNTSDSESENDSFVKIIREKLASKLCSSSNNVGLDTQYPCWPG